MTKLSTKGLVVIALVFSLLAAVLVYSYLQSLAARTVKPGVPVVVAKADIPPKTQIKAEMLKVMNVPAEYIQPGALQDISKAVGVVAREQIVAGEQITQRRLFIEGKSGTFSGIIPKDKRAVSVAVTEVTGVAGMVKPGDFVDVIVTFDPNTVGEHLSQIFLQNVKVLAFNRETEAGAADGSVKKETAVKMTVTLAVSPDEATRLAVADEKGKIRLALRPYLPGEGVVAANALKPRDIVNASGSAAPAPGTASPPAAPAAKGIQVIRGTKTEMVPVN